MAPMAEIRVYKIEKDMDVVKDRVMILVGTSEDLEVSITHDKEQYRPNEDVVLFLKVSNSSGPVSSAIGVKAVDLSVYEVNERFEGFEEIFFSLEDEFNTPQYQICSYLFRKDSTSLSPEVQEVSKYEESDEVRVLTSWPGAKEDAIEFRDTWIGNYWTAIWLLGFIGYLGLFVLALTYKNAAAFLVVVLIFITIVGAALLYTMTSGMIGSTETTPRWDEDSLYDREERSSLLPEISGEFASDPIHIRKYFPETWYWNAALITDENGQAFVTLTAPDSITTWGVEAVASTKDAQIGVGNANITVFQEFFIEPDIPVSVVRGDEFALRILIYNYLGTSSTITVELKDESWFALLSEANKDVHVEANSVSSVYFHIKAKDVGEHNLLISATNGDVEDKVIKQMEVVPDGKAILEIRNGQLDDESRESENLELISNRIENSENVYVKLQGGMEAIALDGAEDFIRFVSGCGEQSTSRLSVDIAAYKNLLEGGVTDEKLFKFETIINQGIQHELIYLVDDSSSGGKAIVWHCGESPDLWLTAWALFAFQDLLDTGFAVDENIIEGFQTYLISNQHTDGSYSFPDVGHWSINSDLQNERMAATAYIIRALLYSHYPEEKSEILKSVRYIESNIDLDDSAFTLALALAALEDAEGETLIRIEIAERLNELKKEENGLVAWIWTEKVGDYWRYYRDNTIETTGYAIIALSKHGGYYETVNKAVKYLLTNRQGGIFGSTHDTAVAFQALDQAGQLRIDDLTVSVKVNEETINSIRFTEANKDITYLVDLRPYLTDMIDIELISKGKGSVLYQVFLEQYVPWEKTVIDSPVELELNVSYDATTISLDDLLTVEVRLKYVGNANMLKMVLIDLRAPVGFSFQAEDFEILLDQNEINQFEIKNRQCMVYIDNVQKDQRILFTYRLKANIPLKATIQGINAYDMYNPNLTTEIEPVEIIVN
jgi:CD109 antigen